MFSMSIPHNMSGSHPCQESKGVIPCLYPIQSPCVNTGARSTPITHIRRNHIPSAANVQLVVGHSEPAEGPACLCIWKGEKQEWNSAYI